MYLAWGKPTIIVKALDVAGAIYRALATPVEDSTSFERADGDEIEAKVEGGGIEDSITKKGVATLTFDIRVAKGRKKPFADVDGVVNTNYEVFLEPEDPAVEGGIHIGKGKVSIKEKFTSADGTVFTVTIKALTPSDTTKPMAEIGTVTATRDTDGSISGVTFTAIEAESDTAA